MTFTPTKYKLMNCGTGRVFEDEGWTLTDPQGDGPALVRAVYEKKTFELRTDSTNSRTGSLYKGHFSTRMCL